MPAKKSKKQLQQEQKAKQEKIRRIAQLKQSISNTKLFGVAQDVPDYSPTYDAPRYADDVTRTIKSNAAHSNVVTNSATLEGEMLERELVAQAEAKRKSKRVAPLYNKGAYQYLTDDTDPTTIGRKL